MEVVVHDDKVVGSNMYELTCPSCQHKMLTPVARLSALATCLRCSHQFEVQRSHVKRVRTLGGSVSAVELDHELSSNSSPAGIMSPNATGSLALALETRAKNRISNHEFDQDPYQGAVNQANDVVLGTPFEVSTHATLPSLPGRGRELARQQALRRQIKTIFFMVGLIIILGVAVTIGVYFHEHVGLVINDYTQVRRGSRQQETWLATATPSGVTTDNHPQTVFSSDGMSDRESQASIAFKDGGAVHDGSTGPFTDTQPVARKIDAQLLPRHDWQVVDQPFITPMQIGPIQITNEQLSKTDEGQLQFSAEIRKVGTRPLQSVTVQVALVDFDERIFARLKIDMTVANSYHFQPIRVNIPSELSRRVMKVVSSVHGMTVAPDCVVLNGAIVEAIGESQQTSVRVTISNPSDYMLSDASFVIMALDEGGLPVVRWQAKWPWPIAPYEQIIFSANTPLDDTQQVRRWDMAGVGQLTEGSVKKRQSSSGPFKTSY